MYKLNKAFYGLKQATGAWYNNTDTYFIQRDLNTKSEPTIYVKKKCTCDILIISHYVDDLLFPIITKNFKISENI